MWWLTFFSFVPDVLQREIMVAETLKSYPYPSLPVLAQQDINYSCTTSCSPSLMPQNLQPYSSPPRQIMDRNLSGLVNGTPSGLGAGGLMGSTGIMKEPIFAHRKQREFIPDNKKDDSYWDRRRRNNEAAKRSREKRRFNDMILEQRVLELSKENHILRAKLNALETKFQVKGEGLVNEEQVVANMPHADQILSLTRRSNLSILAMAAKQQPPTSLLSPNSLPSSPSAPPSSSSSGPQEADSYQLSQYGHHEESSNVAPSHLSYARAMSPDTCSREVQPPQPTFSPEPNHSFYEPSPGALNLSARSSRSPLNMDYCEDQGNRPTEYNGGSCLPHKLRHKTGQQMNNLSLRNHCVSPPSDDLHATASIHYQSSSMPRNLSTSPSPPSSTSQLMYPIKSEPVGREAGEESPGSSDDRDSGVSDSPTLPGELNYPGNCRDLPEEMDLDNEQLRAQVERLTNEVHNLKHYLSRDHRTGSLIRR